MIFFQQESYEIIGAALQVYKVLGTGFAEAVYQEALEIEFTKRNIPYKREQELNIYYDGFLLKKKYYADFVCYDKIIVELKALLELDNTNYSQVYNYLKACRFKLGLLINFGNKKQMEYKRVLNGDANIK
ncbi:MAG: GxxExxY protein [Bacteroidales bacterium]|nr:GxxExxY protein [Bacteroidales bacterium]